MKDTGNATGQYAGMSISAEALRECVLPDTYKIVYESLMDIVKEGSNSDKISACRLILEYTVEKPAQRNDITSKGEAISAGIFVENDSEV